MREKNTWFSRFPLRILLSLMAVSLLVSACSLFGGPSNASGTSTPGTANNSSKGLTPTAAPSHPVASKPKGVGTPTGGKPLPQNEVKPLTFNLVYNESALSQDLAQMYTPGSSTYHQFLTPSQIVQHYALSSAQVQIVTNWLQQNGYSIDGTDALNSSIKVHATVATIENTLHVTLTQYTVAGQTFFVQDGEPTLPASVGQYVASVIGLDNFAITLPKPPFGMAQSSQETQSGNCSNYGAKQSLTRDNLAGAYQISQLYQQGYQGQGMTIGVAEFGEPYSPQDVDNYAACVGLGTPNIQNIDVDGQLAAGSGEGEAAMDLELIAGLAPKATILDYQADTSNTAFAQALVDVLNRVATDRRVQVLSISYGTYEGSFSASEMSAVSRSLEILAAEGISVFVSSGDCGAFSQRLHNIAVVSFPASAPYAIAVGGTHLQVNANNQRASETAWGQDDGAPLCQNEWGSGGGVSENSAFKRPNWQTGPGTTTQYNGGPLVTTQPGPLSPSVSAPNGNRQVPDVAAAAYPNLAIYYKGAWLAAGGTSAAAPIWAAGALLVDQALQQKGKAALGGVPEFYTFANHPGNFHPYNDITSGSNLFYNATKGWDYVTGWGSPNFNDILQLELSLQG